MGPRGVPSPVLRKDDSKHHQHRGHRKVHLGREKRNEKRFSVITLFLTIWFFGNGSLCINTHQLNAEPFVLKTVNLGKSSNAFHQNELPRRNSPIDISVFLD